MYCLNMFSKGSFATNINMVSFLHELIEHAVSKHPLENTCSHKFHIGMAFFLHELIEYEISTENFENNCNHKWHI